MLNGKNLLKFGNLLASQQSGNLSSALEVVRQKTSARGGLLEMKFVFWQFGSEEWLLLGTRFCTSLSSCGYRVLLVFFGLYFLSFSKMLSFLQFSVLNLALRQLNVVFL